MYWITVDIEYMNGTKTYRRFDTWASAGSWISDSTTPVIYRDLANISAGGDKMPKQIIMNIVWR